MTTGTLKDKLQTGTPGHKWRPGHRENKRRTGRSKRNYRLGHRWRPGYWEYKWRPGHRECSISNHHQQSSRAIIRIMRYRSEYGLFFPWTNFMLHVHESVNLLIYLYAQTMGHRRMLYIRTFYVVKNIYISITKRKIFFLLSIFTGGTLGHNYNGT